MQSITTLKKVKSLLHKVLCTVAFAVSAQFLFAQCITPATATLCAGQIQQIQVNPLGFQSSWISTGIINMPAGQPTTTSGIFGPYPSQITVAGMPTTGMLVQSVVITNFTHTYPNDIDIVLVSPTGQSVVLMSDVGGTTTVTNAVYTFQDGAPALTTGTATTGTYAPTNSGAGDNFPPPGPLTVTTGTTLGSFTGNLNGAWKLYGVDDAGGDVGTIASYTINFSTVAPPPTITWAGPTGTIFTNAAATTPYTGGNTATVYVKPTASGANVYTATVSGGTCAGAQTSTITVNPLPTVAVTPTTSCGSPTNTLTATGANTYTWAPAAGLSATTGPTVTANPATTTTYTVTGTTTATGCTNTATALVNSASTAAVITSPPSVSFQIDEGFNAAPAGWAVLNNSAPVGTTSWFLSTNAVFPAFDGPATSAAGANYNSTGAVGNISTWLFTPVVNIKNGDIFSFWTRVAANPALYPDNLEARMSLNGPSTNVGTTATSTGDFSTLLVAVNPGLTPTGYPGTWTKYTVTISGVTGTVPGRLAFRYVVPNGGAAAPNSDFIGLDRVQYATPIGTICAGTVNNLTVNITGGVGPYKLVYSDGTTNYTYNGYVSGSPINVTPSVTTNYTIVSVTSANGCVGSGNSGTANVTITPASTITSQPASTTNICIGGNANITVGTNNPAAASTYVWELSTDGGLTYSTITNNATYSNATTNTLTITNGATSMNGYLYRVKVTGLCGPAAAITSTPSTLSVNGQAVITSPVTNGNFSACTGSATSTNNTTTLSVVATGNALTYQWQVSTNGGTTFTPLANGANYAGVTTANLSIINAPVSFVSNQYRVLVTSGGCTAVISGVQTLTAVNTLPVVTISASPNNTLSPATPVVLTAAVSSATSPITYQWYVNNVLIPGATGQTYNVNPNEPGDYTVTVRDANGCNAVTSAPLTLTLVSGSSNVLFISPSPNNGVFNVRYFNSTATRGATEQARLNVFDEKGTRVFTRLYTLTGPYTQMRVDMGAHNGGIYRVELLSASGGRLQTGSVMVY